MTFRNKIVSAGLVALLVTGPATLAMGSVTAYADPASELEEAAARLESLGSELSDLQSQLAEATTQLEDTDYEIYEKQGQIEELADELAVRRAELGESMSDNYKSGTEGLIGFILGATSAEELASRIYYLDKISEVQAGNIAEVQSLSDQLTKESEKLEAKQADQQGQVSSLEEQVSTYQARVAEARDYYNSLDAQVQAELAAQAEREAEENESLSTVVDVVEGNQGQQGAADSNSGTPSNDDADDEAPSQDDSTPNRDPEPEPDPDPEPEPEPDPEPDNGGGSSVAAGQGVATAYAQIGKEYVYGATGPNAFDCSGLVCYCFGYNRGRTTGQMISSLQSTGDWKTSMSELSYGDLVFPSYGHVGIYVGNGMMIHAANPTLGVVEAPVYAFIGGGSYY